MIVWFLTNVFLSALALFFVRLNETSPHRLRFLVCFLALSAWLIPWTSIGRLLPFGSAVGEVSSWPPPLGVVVEPAWALTDTIVAKSLSPVASILPVVLAVLSGIGALLFAFSALRYAQLVRGLAEDSRNGEHLWDRMSLPTHLLAKRETRPELRIQQQVPGALTTGLLAPTIWIHEDLADHSAMPAALLHELRHVRNRDNAYLWITTLVERLFWWNPLVRYLGSTVRCLQELSCDEACAEDFPEYRVMLNRLILSLSLTRVGRSPHPQVSAMSTGKKFNLRRVRALERRYVMQTRHYVGTVGVIICAAFGVGLAIAQDQDAEETHQTVDQVLDVPSDLSPVAGFEPGTSMEEANETYRSLKLYVMLVERQFDAQQAEIKRLRAQLADAQAQAQRSAVRRDANQNDEAENPR